MNKENLKQMMQKNQIQRLASSNKNNFPTLPQMAKNLGRDVVKNIQSISQGNSINASSEEVQKRKSICQGCEYYNSFQDRCVKCGCFLAVKTYLKASNCPINKW
jgi:hypothetical protein